MNSVAIFTPSRRPRRQLATTTRHASARLIRGPWKQVWPWRVTPWCRGPGRRFAPDRWHQLSLDLQPPAAASAASGDVGFTRIAFARPSLPAGGSNFKP